MDESQPFRDFERLATMRYSTVSSFFTIPFHTISLFILGIVLDMVHGAHGNADRTHQISRLFSVTSNGKCEQKNDIVIDLIGTNVPPTLHPFISPSTLSH